MDREAERVWVVVLAALAEPFACSRPAEMHERVVAVGDQRRRGPFGVSAPKEGTGQGAGNDRPHPSLLTLL